MDILLKPDATITNGKPDIDDGLETAVYISLFTDRRAENDDILPDGTNDRRGYWGDALESEPLGSRLWLLDRSKINNETLGLIESYSKEALNWLIIENVASEIIVNVSRDSIDNSLIKLEIEIVKPNGITETFNFSKNWEALENAV